MPHEIDLRRVLEEAGGFYPECYPFIRDGLAHTVDMTHGRAAQAAGSGSGLGSGSGEIPVPELLEQLQGDDDEDSRHVTGQQLCMGLLDFGRRQYGLLATTVLNRWGIRRTEDFGKIIFAMVDAGLMRKTDEDSIEDFRDVYDFDEVFGTLMPTFAPKGVARQEQLN
ncbi:MAG: Minf_1886 family protein [Planctomycetota bacterium]